VTSDEKSPPYWQGWNDAVHACLAEVSRYRDERHRVLAERLLALRSTYPDGERRAGQSESDERP
jgi:hypothetical protein